MTEQITLKIVFPSYLADTLHVKTKLLRLNATMTIREVVDEVGKKVRLAETERFALYRGVLDDDGEICNHIRLDHASTLASFGFKALDSIELLGAPGFIHLQLPDGTIQYHYQLDSEAPLSVEVATACKKFEIKNPEDKVFAVIGEDPAGDILDSEKSFRELELAEDSMVALTKLKRGGGGGILSRFRGIGKEKDKEKEDGGGDGSGGGVFGVVLSDIDAKVCNEEGIPFILIDSIENVEKRGLDSEGIYRLSGSNDEIQRLKQRYDALERPDLTQIAEVDVVTGTLKLWLRELPEPLLPYHLYDHFTMAGGMSSEGESGGAQMALLRQLVNLLPPRNKAALRVLLGHMNNVVAHSETNQMKTHNMATVVAPNLLRDEAGDTFVMVKDTPVINAVVMEMMLNLDTLFTITPELAPYLAIATCLYTYEPDDKKAEGGEGEVGEASFQEDDIILVSTFDNEGSGLDSGWWFGEVVGGERGLFPANYVSITLPLVEGAGSKQTADAQSQSEDASRSQSGNTATSKENMKALLSMTQTEAVAEKAAFSALLARYQDTNMTLKMMRKKVESRRIDVENVRQAVSDTTKLIDILSLGKAQHPKLEWGGSAANLKQIGIGAMSRMKGLAQKDDLPALREAALMSEEERWRNMAVTVREVNDEIRKLKKYLLAEAKAREELEAKIT